MGSMRDLLLVLGLTLLGFSPSWATEVSYDKGQLLINGEPRILISGSIHYPRSTAEMWPDLIQKAKEGGLDTIETYVFWDAHEPHRGEYNFKGNLDLIRFFKTIQVAGLYAILRIGPYVCAEWNYGGFPIWLLKLPGIKFRTDNQVFKDEMQNFTTLIVDMVKKEKLLAPQGGPIILAQIENEYGNVMSHYGDEGQRYIQWCAKMAESQNTGIPWIMCQQANAPQPMINTCNGFYCDFNFKPNNPKNPKMWTENWTGWFIGWGLPFHHRAAEDVAFAVARFFQSGGVLQNYYMYHGGTNFGRTSGGPYITTSYDYDAPLDEYGLLNQPKWGHLKRLHEALKSAEKILVKQLVAHKDIENNVVLSTFIDNSTSKSVCFLSNVNDNKDVTIDLQNNGKYFLPAWSVSILVDCNKEVYNTAKVNTQISLKTKKLGDVGTKLNWVWKIEPLKDALKGHGSFTANQLLEQKETSIDASDYMWYMTRVNVDASFPKQATLRVNTTGHVLHAYVNNKRIGSDWRNGGGFVFEKPVNLKKGANLISLLSVTVGQANYGAFFDLVSNGIVGGPVHLIGSGNVTKDLSLNEWSYKIGLNGENKQFYYDNLSQQKKWTSGGLSINRPMTWYKTTFKAPLGKDPVVIDMQGMNKGHAWVNGHSLGRFWPTMIAQAPQGYSCSDTCDYRGNYHDHKCFSNCGNPSQRWYHVPRSFLNDGDNTLILFEEMGGNPTKVSIQTITVAKTCGNAYEGNTLELSCQGSQTISAIEFASFGDPQGNCGSFKKGSCDATNTLSVLQNACVGKESCSTNVLEATFGSSNCSINTPKRLAVQAVC